MTDQSVYPPEWGEERIAQLLERDRIRNEEAQARIHRARRFERIDRNELSYEFIPQDEDKK